MEPLGRPSGATQTWAKGRILNKGLCSLNVLISTSIGGKDK